MRPEVEKLVRKALQLDERDRAEVAARLLHSSDEEETEHRAPIPPRPRKPFETKVFDLGPCRLDDLDDISRALAIAEGEAFK
jgi:hypothetical protein